MSKKQQHCTNPSVTHLQSYYRVGYYFAFLDHTLPYHKARFPAKLEGALLVTFLLPGNVSTKTIKVEYAAYLPFPSGFEIEVTTWKHHIAESSDKATNLLSACTTLLMTPKCITRTCTKFLYSYCSCLSVLGHVNNCSLL